MLAFRLLVSAAPPGERMKREDGAALYAANPVTAPATVSEVRVHQPLRSAREGDPAGITALHESGDRPAGFFTRFAAGEGGKALHYVILILAGLIRLIPHPWNFTPIGSIGLFAGTWCSPRIAWAVPLVPLFVGDMITGFYDPFIMAFVYAGFALSAVIGRLFLARKRTALRFGGAVTVNAVVFYLVSNFPVWLTYYPRTSAGLAECYVKGLPFMGNMILGDALFLAVLFGLYFLARKAVDRRQAPRAA